MDVALSALPPTELVSGPEVEIVWRMGATARSESMPSTRTGRRFGPSSPPSPAVGPPGTGPGTNGEQGSASPSRAAGVSSSNAAANPRCSGRVLALRGIAAEADDRGAGKGVVMERDPAAHGGADEVERGEGPVGSAGVQACSWLLGRMLMRRWRRGLLLVALAVLVSACASYGVNTAPDPSSTAELAGVGGGATSMALTLDQVRERADLVLEARVVDVRRSRLNTADGAFPSAESLETRGVSRLDVLTDVEVEVLDVLDARSRTGIPSSGDRFVIIVGGGRFETRLDLRRARALGMTESTVIVPTTIEPPVCPENEPDCGPPEIERETPVTAPVDLTYGMSPGERFTEGETALVYLERLALRTYEGGTFEAWVPVHPIGILRPTGDGRWQAPGSDGSRAPEHLLLLGS